MYARIESSEELELLGDAELVRLFKRGHDDALEVLLHRHSDALYRFCCHLMTNREDAEDICQETMARAITRVDSLQAGSAFRSWLFSIARNLSVDSFRLKKRTCPMPDEELMPLPLYGETPHDKIEISEEHQTVAQALGKLAQSHQRVLVLREVDGLSYADIASELNVSQSAVETLLFRARRRLKEEYSKSAVPVITFLGGIRELAVRLAGPVLGGPAVAKVAVTAAVVGGAVVTAPHVQPVFQALPQHQASQKHATSSRSVASRAPAQSAPVPAGLTTRPLAAVHSAPARPAAHAATSPHTTHLAHSVPARSVSAPPAPPAAPQNPSHSLSPHVAQAPAATQPAVTHPAPAAVPKTAPRSNTGVFRPSEPVSTVQPAAGTIPMVGTEPAAPAASTGRKAGVMGPSTVSQPVAAPTPSAPRPSRSTSPAPSTGSTGQVVPFQPSDPQP